MAYKIENCKDGYAIINQKQSEINQATNDSK